MIVRYEGNPFAVRMSKVIVTLIECEFSIDILIPEGQKGQLTYNYKDGRPLDEVVSIYYFLNKKSFFKKLVRFIDKTNLYKDFSFEKRFNILINTNNYSCILVKDSHRLPTVFKFLKKNKMKIPVVCDMYENVLEQHRDRYFRFAPLWRKIITVTMLNILRLKLMEQKYLPQCDMIFVVIEEMKKYLSDKFKIKDESIAVIENVELIDQFDRIISSKPDFIKNNAYIIISYVGSIGPHRGIEVFIKSIKNIPDTLRSNVLFVVVGARNQDKKKLYLLAEEIGVSEKLNIIGYVPHNEAIKWIKMSDIGVIPHLNTNFISTTIPNKIFQYMAASSAIIASDIGPIGRIIRETDCGFTFTPNSASDLSAKISLMIENPEIIRNKGKNGRIAVEKKYNWELKKCKYQKYFISL